MISKLINRLITVDGWKIFISLFLISIIIDTFWVYFLIGPDNYFYFERIFKNLSQQHFMAQVGFAVLIMPLIETFLFQYLPLRFAIGKNRIIVLLSFILSVGCFSLVHITNSSEYPLLVIPAGIILALCFIIFQIKNKSGFSMTFALHAAINLIALFSLNF